MAYNYQTFHTVSEMYKQDRLQYEQSKDPSSVYFFMHEYFQVAVRKISCYKHFSYEVIYRGFDSDVLRELKVTSGVNTWRIYSSSQSIEKAREDFLTMCEYVVTHCYNRSKKEYKQNELPF